MAKPRKDTSDSFYDIFGSWPAEDRAIALRVLEQTHRQILKVEARTIQPKTDAGAGAAGMFSGDSENRDLTSREKNVQATRIAEEVGKNPVTYDGPEGDPALRQKALEGWKVPCIKCGLYDGRHSDGCPAGEQDRLTLMATGNKAEE